MTTERSDKNKVELHVHLDGAMRPETVFECGKRRGVKLEEFKYDLNGFCSRVQCSEEKHCSNLEHFLSIFAITVSAVAGDEDSLRRVAYEFCEDKARESVLYCEARYSPHLFANTMEKPEYTSPGNLSPSRVVEVINEGFQQGTKDFGIQIRSILCCMRHRPDWAEETLRLCVDYSDSGVVAIDVAGAEMMEPSDPAHQQHVRVFQEAKRLGVNRTVHAGEVGPAAYVKEAVDNMFAQRIGHGYGTVQDETLYKRLLNQDMHFEMCPWSSVFTGSISKSARNDLILRMVRDKANVSFNTDDPLIFNKTLSDEYSLLRSIGVSEVDIIQSNFNAARSSFLPEEGKKKLIEQLKINYGVNTLRNFKIQI